MGGFRQIALQAFGGFHAQRAQFFGAADEVAASLRKLFEGLLELVLRLVDVFADALERLDEAGEFVVKPAAFCRDGEGVLVLLFVAPDVGAVRRVASSVLGPTGMMRLSKHSWNRAASCCRASR